jgi:hypothetical protein
MKEVEKELPETYQLVNKELLQEAKQKGITELELI